MWSSFTQWVSTHKVISIAAAVVVIGAGTAIFMMASAEPDVTTTTSAPTTTTTTVASTTTEAPTTTTVAGALSPINGLPVDDPELLDRRLLAVKNDNHPNARPQSGIDGADAVFEYMAEGVTRFMSFWQQSESEYLGPMRSARPTDQTLLAFFNEPTLAISGGQSWVREMIANVGVHIIGEVEPATFRVSGRRAPHNLYTNTVLLREYADEQGYPDEPIDGPMWEFGPMREDGEDAAKVSFDFLGNPVEWTWDETEGVWLRTLATDESNTVTEDGEESQIGFPVLIAMYVEQASVGDLPTSRTTGQGLVYVFADGKVVQGTWQRDDIDEWFTLADNDGEQILVPPGQVWISLVPNSAGILIE
jgi:Protein of unknown function (DUF3048) N-terminal domain/Protein of unknown function (DUF3048) C-terminal domain